MKNRIVLLCFIFLFSGNLLFAQHARFRTEGSIEFEKSVNMHAIEVNSHIHFCSGDLLTVTAVEI